VAGTPTLTWTTPSGGGAVTSVNGAAGIVLLTTDDVDEGSTNLYATNARTIGATLTGFSAGANTALAATDTVLGAFQKVQGQITAREPAITAGTTSQYLRGDKSLATFATDVRAAVLTGLSTATNSAALATDTILVGIGKLQAQISGNATSISGKADTTNVTQTITALAVTGLGAPVAGSDAANKTYVDGLAGAWTVGSGNAYRTTGNVGIGTSSPNAKLDVNGTLNVASEVGLPGSANGNPGFHFTSVGAANSYGSNIGFGLDTSSNIVAAVSTVGFKVVNSAGTIPFAVTNGGNGSFLGNLTVSGAGNSSIAGSLGVGTTSPSESIETTGNVKAVGFISTSDIRLKKNITTTKGLSKVLKLEGVEYDWKKTGEHDYGLIAQAVELVFPHAVVTDAVTGYKAVKYSNLISPVVEAIKDLYKMIVHTNDDVAVLKREIASVKEKNEQLEEQNAMMKKEFEEMKKRMDRLEKK
jgi:hypothetical protein